MLVDLQQVLAQQLAVSVLVTALEKILADGLIQDEAREMRLRTAIADACRQFKLPTIAERHTADVIPLRVAGE